MKLLAPGAPCTCGPARSIRYAVPPVPGLPDGEVSCRADGGTGIESVRHHTYPAGPVLLAVFCPGVSR